MYVKALLRVYGIHSRTRGPCSAHDHVTPDVNEQIKAAIYQSTITLTLDADLQTVYGQYDSDIYFRCMTVLNGSVWVILGKQLDNSSYGKTLALLCCAFQGKYVFQPELLSNLRPLQRNYRGIESLRLPLSAERRKARIDSLKIDTPAVQKDWRVSLYDLCRVGTVPSAVAPGQLPRSCPLIALTRRCTHLTVCHKLLDIGIGRAIADDCYVKVHILIEG